MLSAPDQNAQHSARTRSGRLIFDLNQGEQWRACTEEARVDGRRQLDEVSLSRHGHHVVQTTNTGGVHPCWDVDGVPRLPILPASKRNHDAGCEGHRILANLHVHPKTNVQTSCGHLSQALQFQPGGKGPAGRMAGAQVPPELRLKPSKAAQETPGRMLGGEVPTMDEPSRAWGGRAGCAAIKGHHCALVRTASTAASFVSLVGPRGRA